MSDANAETPQQAFKNLADQKMKVDTTEPETSLWQGGFSPKAMVGTWLFSLIVTILMAVAYSTHCNAFLTSTCLVEPFR
ncbi:MAG: hypothetical protein U0905_00660 [Pirellulales bacterium]